MESDFYVIFGEREKAKAFYREVGEGMGFKHPHLIVFKGQEEGPAYLGCPIPEDHQEIPEQIENVGNKVSPYGGTVQYIRESEFSEEVTG
jgi:hypothetical protein